MLPTKGRRALASAGLIAFSPLWQSALAGSASGNFDVHIRLTMPSGTDKSLVPPVLPTGLCISESMGQAAQALVTVVCTTGQFVSITPVYSNPYTGTHGGAHPFVLVRGGAEPPKNSRFTPYTGSGTVTSVRVLNLSGREGRLEVQVVF
jgi:hypothetical protein